MFMIQGGLPGASCDGTGSQDANLSLHTDTADLQSDNRRADQYSEYNDDGDDVNILPLPEEGIEVPAKAIGIPMLTPTLREEGGESVETGEETAQDTETTAEMSAPMTASRGATAKATAKRGPGWPRGTHSGVLKDVCKEVLLESAGSVTGAKVAAMSARMKAAKHSQAPTRTMPYRKGKPTPTSQRKTDQSDTPPPYSLGHVPDKGNTNSPPLQGGYSLADLQAQSNFAFLMGRLSASGETAAEVGVALGGLTGTQSSLPQGLQLPEKGQRLPPSYDDVLKDAKKVTISGKLPSLSEKLAALKQKGVSLLEERPGFEAIFNPHGPDNPHREQLNAVAPPQEYTVCMAGKDDENPKPAVASV